METKNKKMFETWWQSKSKSQKNNFISGIVALFLLVILSLLITFTIRVGNNYYSYASEFKTQQTDLTKWILGHTNFLEPLTTLKLLDFVESFGYGDFMKLTQHSIYINRIILILFTIIDSVLVVMSPMLFEE